MLKAQRRKQSQRSFGSLSVGEFFMFKGDLYVRVDRSFITNTNRGFNAVKIHTHDGAPDQNGTTYELDRADKVEAVTSIDINVEYE